MIYQPTHPAQELHTEQFENDVDDGNWKWAVEAHPQWVEWLFGFVMSRGRLMTVDEIKYFIHKGVDINSKSDYIDDYEEPAITPLGYTRKYKWRKMEENLIAAGATMY
jgi:hypothetical protein